MHRAINIKHRIVRRVDIGKAPLATFDTVDLGDEDVRSSATKTATTLPSVDVKSSHQRIGFSRPRVPFGDGSLKPETIGGNNSKKSLSHAGGEEKDSKDADTSKAKSSGGGEVEDKTTKVDTNEHKGAFTEPPLTKQSETAPSETVTQKTAAVPFDKEGGGESNVHKTLDSTVLSRQGTIGRVNIPIKKQDSDSSSSSSGSVNEPTFTFHASRPSAGHLGRADADEHVQDTAAEQDSHDSLVPDNIDPSQILSPSKRKAYERRIERLKVTTSPIARPRSTAPISVVTLDEYATISSPEASPASPSLLQDKLKITLPSDEFTKPKTPKTHSAKRHDSEETCFEFTEEILFSRTKSALVVDEGGNLPLSPRRVLIPPTLTPATSPKLSAAPRLSSDKAHEDTVTTAPKLIYIQHSEPAHKFFGETIDVTDEENWASFPDAPESEGSRNVDGEETNCIENVSTSSDLQEQSQSSAANGKEDETSLDVEKTLPLTASAILADGRAEVIPKDDFECQSASTSLNGNRLISSHSTQTKDSCHANLGENILEDNTKHITLTESLSTDNSISASEPLKIPNVELDPDFESEEILTVEINQSASGCEQHIEIDIRSSGSSGSVSPVGTGPILRTEKSESEILKITAVELTKTSSDPISCTHSDSGKSSVPESLPGINATQAGDSQGQQIVTQDSLQPIPSPSSIQAGISTRSSDPLLIPPASGSHDIYAVTDTQNHLPAFQHREDQQQQQSLEQQHLHYLETKTIVQEHSHQETGLKQPHDLDTAPVLQDLQHLQTDPHLHQPDTSSTVQEEQKPDPPSHPLHTLPAVQQLPCQQLEPQQPIQTDTSPSVQLQHQITEQQQQQPQQDQCSSGLGFQLHHPHTNPFVQGFDPPDSDPFNVGPQQITSGPTNPFLTESSSTTTDLIDFSFSFEDQSV